MIVAIEGLIPSGTMNARYVSPPGTQPAAPPVEADIYISEWLRKQQHQPAGEEPGDPVAAAKTSPAAPQVTEPAPPNPDRNQPGLANPFINPEKLNRVPAATGYVFDAVLDKPSSLRRSFPGINASPGGAAEV